MRHWFNVIHRFSSVCITTSSVTILTAKNTSQAEFDFTSLLHTYFKVDNINSLAVTGLGGTSGFDQLTSSSVVAPDAIRFSENVDTIYREAENMIKIESDGGCVQLERKNMPGRLMVQSATYKYIRS